LNKTKRKKGEHFPSQACLAAMTDSHLKAFFQWIKTVSAGETFLLFVCRAEQVIRSATHRAISKLFDIALAVLSDRH
jgi:hypothetical protein